MTRPFGDSNLFLLIRADFTLSRTYNSVLCGKQPACGPWRSSEAWRPIFRKCSPYHSRILGGTRQASSSRPGPGAHSTGLCSSWPGPGSGPRPPGGSLESPGRAYLGLVTRSPASPPPRPSIRLSVCPSPRRPALRCPASPSPLPSAPRLPASPAQDLAPRLLISRRPAPISPPLGAPPNPTGCAPARGYGA